MKIKNLKIKLTAIALLTGFITYNGMNDVSAVTTTAGAPTNWAFEESSIPLHDAILAKYPTVDTSADGYISIDEANAKVGEIKIFSTDIGGTLSGIEHFTSIGSLYIYQTKIEGEIPSRVWNMTNLVQLFLSENNLNGSIPIEINNLIRLQAINLHTNNFSGVIPSTIGEINTLTYINLFNNDFSGEIPNSIYSLPSLTFLRVAKNKNLEGNPSLGFANSNTLQTLSVDETKMIQAKPNIPSLTLFESDDLASMLLNAECTDLAADVTQADINKAQLSADAWSEPTKSEWQAKIDTAQKILNAKNAVNSLVERDDLATGVDQTAINDAQSKVDLLADGSLKDELQAKIDVAQNIINAKDKVSSILSDDKKTTTPGLTQTDIDDAKDAVNKLEEGPLKDQLLNDIKIIEDIFKNDIDKDGNPDLNIDIDGDGNPDLNITDADGNPIINVVTDGEGNLKLPVESSDKPDVNVVTDGNGNLKKPVGSTDTPDLNVDTDGDLLPDLNIDTDNDLKPDLNVVTDGEGNLKKPITNTDLPDVNVDTDGNGIPNLNIDTDGDLVPDINIVIDENGNIKHPITDTDIPTINIDTDGDLDPDVNIDVDGNLSPDVNIDTDGDGDADLNIIQDKDKNKPNYVEPGTEFPIYNVDTDKDGKPDYNLAYNALDTKAALAIIAKIDVLNRKLYTKASLAAMDAKIPAVTDILNANGVASRVVTIEAHTDQASLDLAVADLVATYNALVLIQTSNNTVAQTGVNAPMVSIVLMVSTLGSMIVLKRRVN